MTPLVQAIQGMASSLERLAGYRGSYSRYGGDSETIHGVLLQREYEIMDDEGVVTLFKSFDWLFRVEQLGDLFPPKPGDDWFPDGYGQTEQQENDLRWHFIARTIGKNPCYTLHDPQGLMVIVHTDRVARA